MSPKQGPYDPISKHDIIFFKNRLSSEKKCTGNWFFKIAILRDILKGLIIGKPFSFYKPFLFHPFFLHIANTHHIASEISLFSPPRPLL